MSNTITVRLPEDLAGWLETASQKAGVPRGRIIREQLELARRREAQPFLHLAGTVQGSRDLSARKGFAKSAKDTESAAKKARNKGIHDVPVLRVFLKSAKGLDASRQGEEER